MSSLPRPVDSYDFNLDGRVQYHGFLLKRSPLSNKLQKRFCIIKEGFLLVFKEQEAERIKRSSFYSVKVNAAIPLGDSVINCLSDASISYGIEINIFVPTVRFLFVCENRSIQQAWFAALTDASRITHANFQISDKLIATLESQGMERVTQSERYRKMLEEEVELRHNESEKASRLEAQQTELQQEKEYAEVAMRELEAELAALRSEMSDAQLTLERTKEEKAALEKQAKQLLEQEAQRELAASASQDSQERDRTADDEMVKLRQEIEERIREKAALAAALEGERSAFDQQAQELSEAVRQLSDQRARASAELAAEQRARQAAEARLREAENSLARLHASVSEERNVYTPEQKAEMKADVGQLKAYFENLIARKSAEADSPIGVRLRRSSRPQQQLLQQLQSQSTQPQQQPFLVRARSQRLRERHRSRLSCLQTMPPTAGANSGAPPVSPLAAPN